MGIVNATPDSFSDAGELPAPRRGSRAGGRCSRPGRTSSTSAASPRAATGPPWRRRRRSRAWCRSSRGSPPRARSSPSTPTSPRWRRPRSRAGAAIVNDVSGLRDPALAEVCARLRRGAGDHAHARGAEGHAARPGPLRRRRRRRRRLPARADGRRAGRRAWARSRSCSTRARTSPRRRRRPSPCCGGWTRCWRSAGRCCWPSRARTSSARSPAARPRERGAGHAGRARARASTPGAHDPARARRRRGAPTSSPCGPRCAATASSRPREGLTPDRYPDGAASLA